MLTCSDITPTGAHARPTHYTPLTQWVLHHLAPLVMGH